MTMIQQKAQTHETYSLFQEQLEEDCHALTSFLKESLSSLRAPESLMDALFYGTLSGGKRLRPFLAREVTRLLGHEAETILPVAAALEMVHCYSLIHDDLPCMDNATLRRGQPTVHCQFDEATALLAGNALLAFAFQLLSEAPYPAESRTYLIRRLAYASGPEGMMGGQHLDLLADRGSPSLEEITHLQSLKTGSLIEASLLMPCDVFDAPKPTREALSLYGRCLGLAFQIKDDLLDGENAPERTGKDGHHDHRKTTFVTHLGHAGATQECQKLVERSMEAVSLFKESARCLEEAALFCLHRQS